jgi:hypothetical protein
MDVRRQSVDHDCTLIRGLLKRKPGPLPAALYHCRESRFSSEGKRVGREVSGPRRKTGDTSGTQLRCSLPLLERHPVRPCSCCLLELRLAIPLSRR